MDTRRNKYLKCFDLLNVSSKNLINIKQLVFFTINIEVCSNLCWCLLSVWPHWWCLPTWHITWKSTLWSKVLQDLFVRLWTPWVSPATPAAVCLTHCRSDQNQTRIKLWQHPKIIFYFLWLSHRVQLSLSSCQIGFACRHSSSENCGTFQEQKNLTPMYERTFLFLRVKMSRVFKTNSAT